MQGTQARTPRVTAKAMLGETSVELDVVGARPFSFLVEAREPIAFARELDDVRVTHGTEEHVIGRCRVEAERDGRHRVAPLDRLVNCRELWKKGSLVLHSRGFEQLPLIWARKEGINAEIAKYTASLVYDLQAYRERFDEVDASLAQESASVQEEVRAKVIAAHGPAFVEFFDRELHKLEDIVKSYSRADHERHGYYFRRHVWPFIMSSLFLTRTNVRPRGYAGDSEMMRQLYEHAYEGPTIFGRLMHWHPCATDAAQAVRNRRRLIVEKVEALRAEQKKDELRLFSVACGPAWEIRDLYADKANCGRYISTLLDQDEEALGEAEVEIGNVSRRHGLDVRARYIKDSVRTMLRTKDLPSVFGRHDFVYSMGLFDYLTQPVAKTVTAKLYDMLQPGGQLLIGNFHVRNPTRLYMEYWMDWVLLYRDDEEMLDLAATLPGAKATTYYEGTRSQVFLDIRKPA